MCTCVRACARSTNPPVNERKGSAFGAAEGATALPKRAQRQVKSVEKGNGSEIFA